jgi:ABC-type uncharacterized transport system involved in gliding motility auxiliary subunit
MSFLQRTFGKYANFVLVLAVVVLLNAAGITLFKYFRLDLTRGGAYTLSKISKQVVRDMHDPLYIYVFYTKNLPAPHNDTERALRDLMTEYSISGNRNFHYEFYDCTESKNAAETSERVKANIKKAQDFGIQAFEFQDVNNGEMKVVRGYLGMAIQKGDIIERIPVIDSARALEYKLTSIIQTMNHKISAIVGLKGKISVKLYFTRDLSLLAPYFGVQGLETLEQNVKAGFEKANSRNFGKLDFLSLDNGTSPNVENDATNYGLQALRWKSFTAPTGQHFNEGKGFTGVVVEYAGKSEKIELLNSQLALTSRGIQQVYQVVDLTKIDEAINAMVDSLLQVSDEIAYLKDKGTASTFEMPNDPRFARFRQQAPPGEAVNFKKIVEQTYQMKEVAANEISKNAPALIVAGPKEKFTPYELFLLDQYILSGRPVIFFIDTLKEVANDGGGFGGMGGGQMPPSYYPMETGLEKMLAFYGVNVASSYVADKSCYEQQQDPRQGGGRMSVYFAPVILGENMNQDTGYLRPIKRMITLKISPLEIQNDAIKKNNLKVKTIFSSSEKAWELRDNIMLVPQYLEPPSKDNLKKYPLAAIVEGEFPSYFAETGMPTKDTNASTSDAKAVASSDKVSSQNDFIKKGKRSRIFIVGTSEIMKNQILGDDNVEAPNATFLMNIIDDIYGRVEWANMRSKSARFNPIEPYNTDAPFFKRIFTNRNNFIIFNWVIVPLLVVFAGLMVWVARRNRRRQVEKLYSLFA